ESFCADDAPAGGLDDAGNQSEVAVAVSACGVEECVESAPAVDHVVFAGFGAGVCGLHVYGPLSGWEFEAAWRVAFGRIDTGLPLLLVGESGECAVVGYPEHSGAVNVGQHAGVVVVVEAVVPVFRLWGGVACHGWSRRLRLFLGLG